MRSLRTLIIAAAGVLALAGTAAAQNPLHNFQVKLGVSGVLPDTSATISTIGGAAMSLLLPAPVGAGRRSAVMPPGLRFGSVAHRCRAAGVWITAKVLVGAGSPLPALPAPVADRPAASTVLPSFVLVASRCPGPLLLPP